MYSKFFRILHSTVLVALLVLGTGWQSLATARTTDHGYASLPSSARQLLSDDPVTQRTFEWFWQSADPKTGLIPDAYPGHTFSSIAAVGFGLTAYGVGVERGYITREQAVERTLATLRFFKNAPQNDSEDDATGYHGFYYHFLDMHTGKRAMRSVELSSVDTTLLLGGVLFAESYYDRDTPQEKEIRQLADAIYRDVDWTWMQARKPLISMGWTPGGKFIPSDWKGYDEGMLVYILALGSPTHPVEPDAWTAWLSTNDRTWGTFQGQTFLNFAPLFGHQYTEAWVDFRGIRDSWSRDHNLDYFENSRRATYAQRAYADRQSWWLDRLRRHVWDRTASNGPGDIEVKDGIWSSASSGYRAWRGSRRHYRRRHHRTDRGGWLDRICAGDRDTRSTGNEVSPYNASIYDQYGFVDAFNPSFHATVKPTRQLVG